MDGSSGKNDPYAERLSLIIKRGARTEKPKKKESEPA
jgi:hypothetical protein